MTPLSAWRGGRFYLWVQQALKPMSQSSLCSPLVPTMHEGLPKSEGTLAIHIEKTVYTRKPTVALPPLHSNLCCCLTVCLVVAVVFSGEGWRRVLTLNKKKKKSDILSISWRSEASGPGGFQHWELTINTSVAKTHNWVLLLESEWMGDSF